jgi:hypothetical protein
VTQGNADQQMTGGIPLGASGGSGSRSGADKRWMPNAVKGSSNDGVVWRGHNAQWSQAG